MKKLSKEFKLPEKWKTKDCEAVSLYARKRWGTDVWLGNYTGFYCENLEQGVFLDPIIYKEKVEEYLEITFEQFEKYVLKKQTEIIDYSYLNPMLKKLNIK